MQRTTFSGVTLLIVVLLILGAASASFADQRPHERIHPLLSVRLQDISATCCTTRDEVVDYLFAVTALPWQVLDASTATTRYGHSNAYGRYLVQRFRQGERVANAQYYRVQGSTLPEHREAQIALLELATRYIVATNPEIEAAINEFLYHSRLLRDDNPSPESLKHFMYRPLMPFASANLV